MDLRELDSWHVLNHEARESIAWGPLLGNLDESGQAAGALGTSVSVAIGDHQGST